MVELKLDRAGGTGRFEVWPPNSEAFPDSIQGNAAVIAKAILQAEQKTGIRVSDTASMTGHKQSGRASIATNRAPPELSFASEDIFKKVNAEQMECLVLHELGHAYYRKAHEVLDGPGRAAFDAMESVRRLQGQLKKWPERMATGIIAEFGSVDAFAQELAHVMENATRNSGSLYASEAVCQATNSQAAQWLHGLHQSLKAGRGHESPLAIYTQLPGLDARSDYALERMKRCGARDAKPGTAQAAAQCGDRVEKHMPQVRELLWMFGKPLRAEELLCDDFSTMLAKNPRANAAMLNNLMSGSIGYTHPHITAREPRAEMLAARVEKARTLCGSLAPSGLEMMDKHYGEWLGELSRVEASQSLSIMAQPPALPPRR